MNGDGFHQSFHTTRWSIVRRAAAEISGEGSNVALAEFCMSYRAPLLAFARAVVHNPQDAEDLVQGFFARLLEKNFIARAAPEAGRMRTFLLTCLKRHITDESRRMNAAKRGAGNHHVSFTEAGPMASPAPAPDAVFHRQWALVVLDRAVDSLRFSWKTQGKAELFEALRHTLGFSADEDVQRDDLANTLGMSRGAVKTAVYRLRKDYRECLMREIAETLEEKTTDEVMAELKDLIVWT